MNSADSPNFVPGQMPPWPAAFSPAVPMNGLHPSLLNQDLNAFTLYPEPIVSRLPQKMIDTYWALQHHLQISPQLDITMMIGSLSVAASPLRRVRSPEGKEGPTAWWSRAAVEPSGGKTETLKALSVGHDTFKAEENERYKAALKQYDLKRQAYNLKKKRLLESVTKITDEEFARQSQALLLAEPQKPKRWPAMMTSGTAAGIEKMMRESYGFIAYVNPDAGNEEVDTIFADSPRFCKLWSGDSLHRATGNSSDLEGVEPALTMILLLQPDEAKRQDQQFGERHAGNGFRARMPSVNCEPTAAREVVRWQAAAPITEASPEIAWFNERTYELIKAAADTRKVRTDVFADSAVPHYFRLKEIAISARSRFSVHQDIKDFWGKAVEWTCRLASLIQALDGDSGVITDQHFCAAADLTLFYLQHAKCLYGQQVEWVEPQEHKDARALEEFLSRRCAMLGGRGTINRNDVLRWGPNQLRNRQRRDLALAVLVANGRLSYSYAGRTCFLVLNSDFFPEVTHYGVPLKAA